MVTPTERLAISSHDSDNRFDECAETERTPMEQNNDNQQADFSCGHCTRRFSRLGDFAKHLMADHHFAGDLTPEEIDRVCFGPL